MPDTDPVTLSNLIRTYSDDPELGVLPDDPDAEIRRNTWSYDPRDAEDESADQLGEALREVASALRARFDQVQTAAWFYVWYDMQAGQLRCSLTSQQPLPFGGRIGTTDKPVDVMRLLLADNHPGEVRWDHLAEGGGGLARDASTLVWVCHI